MENLNKGKFINSHAEIGRGSMGTILLGETESGLLTAVKFVGNKDTYYWQLGNEINQSRFLQEAGGHTNIVSFYDSGTIMLDEKDGLYLAMEYIPGGTLLSRQRDLIMLRLEEVVYCLSQVADGLAFMHEHGLAHRDVKGENILFKLNGKGKLIPKICDLGLSTKNITVTNTKLSRIMKTTLDPVGSLLYMAPEQFEGQTFYTSDQYSLAILAFLLITGNHPFVSENNSTDIPAEEEEIEYYNLHRNAPIPSFGNYILLDDRSAAIQEVITIALAKNPNARYPDMNTFKEALLQNFSRGDAAWKKQMTFHDRRGFEIQQKKFPPEFIQQFTGTKIETPITVERLPLKAMQELADLAKDFSPAKRELFYELYEKNIASLYFLNTFGPQIRSATIIRWYEEIRSGNYESAFSTIQDALLEDPDFLIDYRESTLDSSRYFLTMTTLLARKKLDQVDTLLTEGLGQDNNKQRQEVRYNFSWGIEFDFRGDYEKSFKCFAAFLGKQAFFNEIREKLALKMDSISMKEFGDDYDFKVDYEAEIADRYSEKEMVFASYGLSRTLIFMGEYKLAIEVLEQTLKIHPLFIQAQNLRATALLLSGKYPEALFFLRN